MLLPGSGRTKASCTAVSIQNAVKNPGVASPGSSQAGAIVTYSANFISPSGLVCATAEPIGPTAAAPVRTAARASFFHHPCIVACYSCVEKPAALTTVSV
jgi:hypothetical protein